jgi:hypothetical protein
VRCSVAAATAESAAPRAPALAATPALREPSKTRIACPLDFAAEASGADWSGSLVFVRAVTFLVGLRVRTTVFSASASSSCGLMVSSSGVRASDMGLVFPTVN